MSLLFIVRSALVFKMWSLQSCFFYIDFTFPPLCLFCRSHGGHSSVRAHDRLRISFIPDVFNWVSPDRLQVPGAQRGRHSPADHAAAPGDPEPPGNAKIPPLPRREPMHPLLLPAWRTGRSQDPGGLRCGCDRGWCDVSCVYVCVCVR